MQVIDNAARTKVSAAKRNCVMCCGRWRLRPVEKEKSIVQSSLNYLVEFFDDKYTKLRRSDANEAAIKEAIENKRFCMDLVEKCQSCNKDVDIVNRLLLARFR